MNKEKLRSKINKVKLALMLGGTVASGPLSAAQQSNGDGSDGKADANVSYVENNASSSIVVDNQDHQIYMQSREKTIRFNDLAEERTLQSADQTHYNLGDGYFMTASSVTDSRNGEHGKKEVLYMSAPDGKTYDCAFLHNGKYDFMPTGLSEGGFKENFPDPKLADQLEKQVKKTLNLKTLSNQDICDYNSLMTEKKLHEAEKLGYPAEAVGKIGVYLAKMREAMEDYRIYVGSFKTEHNTSITVKEAKDFAPIISNVVKQKNSR